jgi:hypothetical protein
MKEEIGAWHQWLMHVILDTQKAEIRRIVVPIQPGQILQEILSRKNPSQKRAGRVTQVVEHLPSKHETLCSNPSTEKKKGQN